MSMIDRYKKSGGFLSLLNLVETSGVQKQEKFLAIIEEESPAWSEAIRQKMLTIPRIFAWNQVILTEIFTRVQPLTIAVALNGLGKEESEKILNSMNFTQKRQMEDLRTIASTGTGEISAAYIRIITEVREMIAHGVIKFEKFDPSLVIDEAIEEKLSKNTVKKKATEDEPSNEVELVFNLTPTSASANHSGTHSAGGEDVEQLRRKILNLNKELESSRKENKVLQDKLTQIKKIA